VADSDLDLLQLLQDILGRLDHDEGDEWALLCAETVNLGRACARWQNALDRYKAARTAAGLPVGRKQAGR
jgi:hypothetical protein